MIRIAFFFTVFLIAVVASGQQRPKPQENIRFDLWDKNRDGKLTKEELPANLRQNFERVDRDGDGFVSREEDAAVGRKGSPQAGGAKGEAEVFKGVRKLADLDYAGNDNPRQKLDLYLPEKPATDKPLPVIAFIHGGGWQNGDKASGGRRIESFVASGTYAALSIGYRLSDEAQWPAQIHDCKAAIRWIRANAEEYNLNASRIAVWGTSAGGHLVAMLGVSHGIEDLEGDMGPHTDQSSEVACVVDFYGPTELLTMNDHGSAMDHDSANSPESKLIGGPIQKNREKAASASPITHASDDDEPILIVHGDQDPLVPFLQSVEFEKKLEAAGVPVVLVRIEGGEHGKGFGPSVNRLVEDFLARQLLGEDRTLGDTVLKAGE